jgi:hypothetical protein
MRAGPAEWPSGRATYVYKAVNPAFHCFGESVAGDASTWQRQEGDIYGIRSANLGSEDSPRNSFQSPIVRIMNRPVLIVSINIDPGCSRHSENAHPSYAQVGGGPSGLVLALSLLLNGVSVRIIDKERVHRTGSKGNGISVRPTPISLQLQLI